jgi:phage terminase large subunit GpA-like protein
VRVPADITDDWCEQMTVESRVQARTARGIRMVWACPPCKRNEAWDCAVYALFAAHALGLDKYTQSMWDRLRERIAPLQADLLSGEGFAPAPSDPATEPPDQPSGPAASTSSKWSPLQAAMAARRRRHA